MTMHRAQEKMARGQVPAQEMLDGGNERGHEPSNERDKP